MSVFFFYNGNCRRILEYRHRISWCGGRAGHINQKQFYKTQAWRRARDAYIDERKAIDGGLCEACGQEPGRIVHHWKTWLDDINCNDPDIALNPDNFMLECQTCHNQERDPRKATPGRCRYGPNGEILRNTRW